MYSTHPFSPQLNDSREIWSGEVSTTELADNSKESTVFARIIISDRVQSSEQKYRMLEIIPQEALIPKLAEKIMSEYGFDTNFNNWDDPGNNSFVGIIEYID